MYIFFGTLDKCNDFLDKTEEYICRDFIMSHAKGYDYYSLFLEKNKVKNKQKIIIRPASPELFELDTNKVVAYVAAGIVKYAYLIDIPKEEKKETPEAKKIKETEEEEIEEVIEEKKKDNEITMVVESIGDFNESPKKKKKGKK